MTLLPSVVWSIRTTPVPTAVPVFSNSARTWCSSTAHPTGTRRRRSLTVATQTASLWMKASFCTSRPTSTSPGPLRCFVPASRPTLQNLEYRHHPQHRPNHGGDTTTRMSHDTCKHRATPESVRVPGKGPNLGFSPGLSHRPRPQAISQ
jgi:hypothetical protein